MASDAMKYISHGVFKRADRLVVGDLISVTDHREDVDFIESIKRRGRRVFVILESGDIGNFKDNHMVRMYQS